MIFSKFPFVYFPSRLCHLIKLTWPRLGGRTGFSFILKLNCSALDSSATAPQAGHWISRKTIRLTCNPNLRQANQILPPPFFMKKKIKGVEDQKLFPDPFFVFLDPPLNKGSSILSVFKGDAANLLKIFLRRDLVLFGQTSSFLSC